MLEVKHALLPFVCACKANKIVSTTAVALFHAFLLRLKSLSLGSLSERREKRSWGVPAVAVATASSRGRQLYLFYVIFLKKDISCLLPISYYNNMTWGQLIKEDVCVGEDACQSSGRGGNRAWAPLPPQGDTPGWTATPLLPRGRFLTGLLFLVTLCRSPDVLLLIGRLDGSRRPLHAELRGSLTWSGFKVALPAPLPARRPEKEAAAGGSPLP